MTEIFVAASNYNPKFNHETYRDTTETKLGIVTKDVVGFEFGLASDGDSFIDRSIRVKGRIPFWGPYLIAGIGLHDLHSDYKTNDTGITFVSGIGINIAGAISNLVRTLPVDRKDQGLGVMAEMTYEQNLNNCPYKSFNNSFGINYRF